MPGIVKGIANIIRSLKKSLKDHRDIEKKDKIWEIRDKSEGFKIDNFDEKEAISVAKSMRNRFSARCDLLETLSRNFRAVRKDFETEKIHN